MWILYHNLKCKNKAPTCAKGFLHLYLLRFYPPMGNAYHNAMDKRPKGRHVVALPYAYAELSV